MFTSTGQQNWVNVGEGGYMFSSVFGMLAQVGHRIYGFYVVILNFKNSVQFWMLNKF